MTRIAATSIVMLSAIASALSTSAQACPPCPAGLYCYKAAGETKGRCLPTFKPAPNGMFSFNGTEVDKESLILSLEILKEKGKSVP